MLVQYLVTMVKKSEKEIVTILNSLNISGDILVGNQLMDEESEFEIKSDKYSAKVYNLTSKGVSKNRNFLTLKAVAKYVAYLDDDVYFDSNIQTKVEAFLSESNYNAIRFNVGSDNENRPIKPLSKKGYIGFRKLSSYGVWGIFFKRHFLVDNNLFFREDVGPGTSINHGEDGLFNKNFLKYSKIYSMPILAFRAKQSESTWHGENRNLELEMFSHGYLYELLYPGCPKIMANIYVATHMNCYPSETKKSFLRKHMFAGIDSAKKKEYHRSGGPRVLILGPIVTDKTSGGVAVFDEGLYNGFLQNGDEVNLLSIEKSKTINNLVVKIKNPNLIIFNKNKIARIIKKYQPDIVISSLQYSIGIKTYKRKWPNAKYIQILHGTPCPINGRFKSWCVNYVARFSRKHFDKLVTVSHLSWAINKKINRVECDAIINTGCNFTPITNNGARKYDFCYVGRLYRDKNIEKMMDALIELHNSNPSLKVCVAGYGEQENLFQKGGKYDLDFIDFKGKVDHSKVFEIYSNSRFFISLCELEACGLAFSEAALCGCNPIASLSSGQSQFFLYKDFYHVADASSVNNLVNDLKSIEKKYREIDKNEINSLTNLFSYKTIAKKYKDLV